jgi:putative transposase
MQAQVFGDAGAELDQVEAGRPLGDAPGIPTVLRLALNLAAIVPDLITRPRMAREMLSRSAILDAIFEREHHPGRGNWSEGEMQDFRTGRHVVYALHVHLVFVTKYRREVLSALAIGDLSRIFAKVCKDFDAELIECNGEDDHVHLLVNYPPKVALSNLVNSLKGVSSRRLREDRPEVSGRYRQGVLWSPSYFAASCGGASLSVISQYVRSQREASYGHPAIPPRPEARGFSRRNR